MPKLLVEEIERLWAQLQAGTPMISGGSPARVVRVVLNVPNSR